MTKIDWDEEGTAMPSRVQLASITHLVTRVWELDKALEKLNERAKALSEERHKLVTEILPDALQDAGVREIKTTMGDTVTLRSVVAGSIPAQSTALKDPEAAALRNKALTWLRKNNLGDIIKTTVSVAFAKGQDKAALALLTQLKKKKMAAELAEVVHHQTLNKILRERFDAGKPIPQDVFSLWTGNIAEIKNG